MYPDGAVVAGDGSDSGGGTALDGDDVVVLPQARRGDVDEEEDTANSMVAETLEFACWNGDNMRTETGPRQ